MQSDGRIRLIGIVLILVSCSMMIANNSLNICKNNELISYHQMIERIKKDREAVDIWSLDRSARTELLFKYEREENKPFLDMHFKKEHWSFWLNIVNVIGGVATMFAGGCLLAIWRKNESLVPGLQRKAGTIPEIELVDSPPTC